MKTGEVLMQLYKLNQLVYNLNRISNVQDDFIDMVREHMPSFYGLIEDKENSY